MTKLQIKPQIVSTTLMDVLPLEREDIKAYLPHREPILFIDKVTALGERHICARSEVRADSVFFKGHFPNLPIMPGVLIIETIAQAGALLVSLTQGLDPEKFIAFSGVESAKFKKPVFPGSILTLDVEIEKIRRTLYKFTGRASVESEVVASLKFSAAEMDFQRDGK